MGQEQSRPERPTSGQRRVNWWEALRLGSLTAAVAALQWFRYALLAIEDDQRNDRPAYGRRHSANSQAQSGKGLVGGLSPETRRALVNLIDYQLTPVLVDQWRLGLVKVILDPAEGPVLPDEDPQVRKAILDSLQTYQEAQDQRRTFREGAVPQRYAQQQAQQARHQERREQNPEASTSSRRQAEDIWPQHAPASQAVNEVPSAPPLYPTIDPPSAPPLTTEEAGPSSVEEQEPQQEDCGICMDAQVEVQIEGCGHQLCCECAKAICCLEGRAPQCPFCRGAMRGVKAVALRP